MIPTSRLAGLALFKVPPMDTLTLMATIDGLLAQLRAGDRTAIDRIVDTYNARSVPPGHVMVKGWTVILT